MSQCWEVFLGVSFEAIGAFFGFGIALILYYMQIKSDRKKDILNTDKEQLDRIMHFIHLLQGSKQHIVDLFEIVQIYIVKQRKDLLLPELIKFKVNNDINRLNHQDDRGFFLAYRKFYSQKESWLTDYKNLYSRIDYISEVEIEIKRLYRYNNTDTYQKQLRIKDVIETIAIKMAENSLLISNRLGEDKVHDKAYNFLDVYLRIQQDLIVQNQVFQIIMIFFRTFDTGTFS
jgi:hypothetical protein